MGKYYLGTGSQQINFQVVDATGVINDLNLSGLYLSVTGKAADADKLDSYDSSYFLNNSNVSGVQNYLAKFTQTNSVGISSIYDNASGQIRFNGYTSTSSFQEQQ